MTSHAAPSPSPSARSDAVRTRTRTAAALALASGLIVTAPAHAATTGYVSRTLVEPLKPGLPVTGALSDLVAGSNARVVVPSKWQLRGNTAGKLSLSTTQNPSCRYDLTYTVKSTIGPAGDASAYVASKLRAASSRHLLDSGERGNRAFRVVRRPGIGGRVQVDALWAGVLTKRSDIAPAGQSAWTEISVTARSRTGNECHSGTWRVALGPAIGDSLAVARSSLRFVRKR
jgi:hypothetical protein